MQAATFPTIPAFHVAAQRINAMGAMSRAVLADFADEARVDVADTRRCAAAADQVAAFDHRELSAMVGEFCDVAFLTALDAGDEAAIGKKMVSEYREWIEAGVRAAAAEAEHARDLEQQKRGAL